jgi:hypothetical protein
MQVIDGEIGAIGGAARLDTQRGETLLSVLEIGDRHLKEIVLRDTLKPHVITGKRARLLLATGLSRGIITRPYIAAVEVDGKKYKSGPRLIRGAIRVLLYGAVSYFVLSRFSVPLAVTACAGIAAYYAKELVDLVRF